MKSSGSNQVEVSTGRNVRMGVSSERRESLDNIRRECAPPRASCLAQRSATRVRSQPAKKAAPGWTILYPQLDHHPLLVYFILPSCQSLSYASPLDPAGERSQHPCARSLSPSPRLRPSRSRPPGRARRRSTLRTFNTGLAPPPTDPGLPASLPTSREHCARPSQRRHAPSATEAEHRVRNTWTTHSCSSSPKWPLPL